MLWRLVGVTKHSKGAVAPQVRESQGNLWDSGSNLSNAGHVLAHWMSLYCVSNCFPRRKWQSHFTDEAQKHRKVKIKGTQWEFELRYVSDAFSFLLSAHLPLALGSCSLPLLNWCVPYGVLPNMLGIISSFQLGRELGVKEISVLLLSWWSYRKTSPSSSAGFSWTVSLSLCQAGVSLQVE